MIIHWLTILISLLFVIINGDVNKTPQSDISVTEHESNNIIDNDSLDQSWKTSAEKILIRVTRMNTYFEQSPTNDRQRRQLTDTDDILGMAKKVAITVFVVVSLCIVCCIVTTIYICVKCCCGDSNNRKRNQGFNTVPQPIIIHTSSPNYQPQYHQQQAPPPPPQQLWNSENHPMLSQPSAPPQPNDDFHMERPPPYEKICGN